MPYKQPGSPYYWTRRKHKGRQIYRNTRCRTLREARDRERELWRRFDEELAAATRFGCDVELIGRCPECDRPFREDRAAVAVDKMRLCGEGCRERWNRKVNPVPTLEAFLVEEFLPYARARMAGREKSEKHYTYGCALLLGSSLAPLRLDELTSQHAARFAASIASRKLSASTANCGLRILRHALRLAEEWKRLDRAPRISLATGERQRDRVVSDAEWLAYHAACPQPWRDVALLVRREAIRPGEAFALRWEHLENLQGHGVGLILITAGKSRAARRRLPMTPDVRAALAERHVEQSSPTTGWIFPAAGRSGHVEQGSTKSQHATALARSGVQHFEPYCLRHTRLTELGASGCDAFTLAKIAGHSSITMTSRYVHPQADAMARAFQKSLPEEK